MKMSKQFTWIPFYKEFAEKLLTYRNDRKPLLDYIYTHREELLAGFLHDKGGADDLYTDIDPFTVLGLFNRKIKDENRINVTRIFKEHFSIGAELPTDFTGIPVLNPLMSTFFFRGNQMMSDIENLWTLFTHLVEGNDIEEAFNNVIQHQGINANITMAMFWIRPTDFLAYDSTNRRYLKEQYGINFPSKVPEYKEYMSQINDIRKKMEADEIKEKTFYELSARANRNDLTEGEPNYYDGIVSTWKKRKNIVLYGAPGTGKTYDIPELVVRLCCPDFDASNYDRKELMKRYNQLKQEKRVKFTTFHQSMDYEDWIEGLKPSVTDNGQVTYNLESGTFKQLCEEAERPIVEDKRTGISDDAVVWKVSLMKAGDNPVRKECMENGHIRIGWDTYGAVISDNTDWSAHYNGEGKRILDAFINKMKVGDIVMSCYSGRTIDAIGVVVGDYEFDDSYDEYKRIRKVNWLLKGIDEDIVELNDGKPLVQATVYQLNSITLDKVKTLLDKHQISKSMADNTKPYVMAIDEMNRGNVSKVFGELITLLEPDKRKGCKNAESVILPYSKKPFSVPKNVYLVATMNTADRSLGTLDYAIRRRFAFIAQKPFSLEGEVDGFDEELFQMVSKLFISNYEEYKESGWWPTTVLQRANTLSEDYRPEDVWIGQSYFIMQDEEGEDVTAMRLEYEIIPLLEEYVRNGVLKEEANATIEKLRNRLTELWS